MTKISVIVPFYNSEKTLNRCVDSILNQTFKNFELLAVSDGSTDSSESIIKEYEKTDERVRLISKRHAGVSAARNRGIKEAKGEFIQFIDSDDYIEPQMFETMLTATLENDADVAVCDFTHPCLKNYLGDCILDFTKKSDQLKLFQNSFAGIVPWNKLFRKSVIKTLFDEEMHIHEDDIFCYANLFNAKKIVSIAKPLYHYYVAPSSNDPAHMSAISKIASDPQFYVKKNCFWYIRTGLVDKTLYDLKKRFSENVADEFAYIRVFDFFIWEFLILASSGVDRKATVEELVNIFNEKEFKKALKIKEDNYGIKFKELNEQDLRFNAEQFVDSCYDLCKKYNEGATSLKPFYVCLGVFTKLFVENTDGNGVDKADLVGEFIYSLKKNSTQEAAYVNKLNLITVA